MFPALGCKQKSAYIYDHSKSQRFFPFCIACESLYKCTHLHFDHAGGNTKFDGGKIVPTFPNARYWVSSENWNLANHPSQKDVGSFMEHDWNPMKDL